MVDGFWTWVAAALIGYFFGALPTAYLLVRFFTSKNVMDWGTGNVGTLNVHRATNSKVLTLLTLLGDMLKAALAIIVGYYLARGAGLEVDTGATVGGIAAIAGHNYSVFLRFKGGKGLSCSASIGFYFSPIIAGLWISAFLATVLVSRWLVLGQIVATATLPVICYFLVPEAAVASYLVTALVLLRHSPRIRNLIEGTEPKLYYKLQQSR